MSERSKSELRAFYRKARADFAESLSDRERQIAFGAAPKALSAYFAQGKTVAGYIPVGSEADPRALLGIAHAAGCKTALPFVTNRAAPMQFLCWSPGDPLHDGPFGLMQPESAAEPCQPDIVLTPLVAFDLNLMRLGQGAGHYDRALSLLDRAVVVGIAWSAQVASLLPADPWDIPLNAVLTEKAWITR
jgi:5-formyltetrahydrofolate cyclo-ligase